MRATVSKRGPTERAVHPRGRERGERVGRRTEEGGGKGRGGEGGGERFLAALRTGQLQELMEVMAPDVVLTASLDGN